MLPLGADADRLVLHEKDVREKGDRPADIRVAQNFSYCAFKERSTLLGYFQRVRRDLADAVAPEPVVVAGHRPADARPDVLGAGRAVVARLGHTRGAHRLGRGVTRRAVVVVPGLDLGSAGRGQGDRDPIERDDGG